MSNRDEDAREPGEENDADSSFYSVLYGPNSSLDPDHFIQEVLQTLGNHGDLTKQFKRFLPEDDEEDEQSMEQKYWQFRNQMNMEMGSNDINPTGEPEDMALINQMKMESYQNLLKLLEEYGDVKAKKCVQEALKIYGDRIMSIAESYQKFVVADIKKRLQEGIMMSDSLENQMNLILSIIPQEIIDNYNVSSPQLNMNTQSDPQSPLKRGKKGANKLKLMESPQNKKRIGRPRRNASRRGRKNSFSSSMIASSHEEQFQEFEQSGSEDAEEEVEEE